MTDLSDVELLKRLRDSRSREALDIVVRRYIGLVHAAAIRQTRDPHLAADITQAVFIVLVRRADSLRADTVLPNWLFTVTRHAVSNARRVAARRTFHEQQRAMMTSPQSEPSAESNAQTTDEVRALLDDAIARLGHVERSSVLLHFFGQKTHREVGEALGMSEEAARKRVSRGLDRLREIVAQRSHAGGASVASVLAVEGAAAAQFASHASLVSSTVNVALLANSIAAPTGAAAVIANGVSHMLTLTKIKVAAAAGLALLVVGGAVAPVVVAARRSAAPVVRPQVTNFVETRIATRAPATQPSFVAQVSDKTKLEFAGVNSFPPDPENWWAINGEPIELNLQMPEGRHVRAEPAPKHLVALRLANADASIAHVYIAGSVVSANMITRDNDTTTMLCAFSLENPDAKTATMTVGVTDSPWKTAVTNEKPADEFRSEPVEDLGAITFAPIAKNDEGSGSKVVVEHNAARGPQQLVVVDEAGKEHASDNINVRSDGQTVSMTCTFDVEPEKVKKVLFQTRAITKFVEAMNISLEHGAKTQPKIDVRDTKDGK